MTTLILYTQLPNACDYEIANYTILIWETSRQNETLIFGPKEHFYRNGRSVTREIPSDSSEPDLVIDTEYLMIINVTTPAGSSISGIINFCKFSLGYLCAFKSMPVTCTANYSPINSL